MTRVRLLGVAFAVVVALAARNAAAADAALVEADRELAPPTRSMRGQVNAA